MATKWSESYDIVVVGSGASGLAAAITAQSKGMKTLIIEKLDKWGGSSSYSGGGLWIPNNYLMQDQDAIDSSEEALQYMENVIHYKGQATSRARKEAYVHNAPEMVLHLKKLGFKWRRADLYPDYYPNVPGAKTGRCVEGEVFNAKKLGAFRKTMLIQPGMPNMPFGSGDVYLIPLATQTWAGFKKLASVVLKTITGTLTGKEWFGAGKTLVAQMMYILQEKYKTPVWLNSPLTDIVIENNRVAGVTVTKDGKQIHVKANKAVLLGAGGFAKNAEYRQKYQPVTGEWSSAAPGDQGEGIQIGEKTGGALALMDEAWWGGSFKMNGLMNFSIWERSYPGAIMVDHHGNRYVNESSSYVDLGRKMLEQESKVGGAAPSWLIMDGIHRKKYLFGTHPGGMTPSKLIKDSTFVKASSLEDLAKQCGINAENLNKTVKKFNSQAAQGIDDDFQRGNDIYDRYYSDYRVLPNSTLAPIENPPFWAIRYYPGDLGTKGGLVTDEHARVLRQDGSVIEGLYASGNNTASVMGETYPGAGSTIGPACTFSYIAMNHAAEI
ncbi:MAG: FAD-dependent oxidoreductase [Cyclobacteriaceae bacterium]